MNEDLIAELGISDLSAEKQEYIIDELNMRVGEALVSELSDEQVKEYEDIINGHQEVITAWLDANVPNYADTVAYQELAVGFETDPDKVPADKVFASMAWIEKNHPNLDETVESIKADIKANIEQYK